MFSAETEKKIQEIIARYPVKRSALLPVLFVVQEELGYLPDEALHEVARRLDLTFLDVETVVSFYTMFHRRPIGRYHVQVCRNISCYLCGAEAILEHLKRRLGIRPGETTPDGRFTLSEVECIGACSWAPAMQINFTFYHHLTPERVDEILASLP
ncbi:MAG: NADH-quinone oxidoreductase subunit NuoE [Blastocatellia bacterium]|nr:NADH-quinone oxidoreductase subunit NuoE [Blastocatellia bacterium]MCS7158509.1 NADH-quinone oxidoreductase subunit NuoE [Blastocatellia bacterium]MDW8167812.1 NADH-quinone oxidoreductase subunit NuoE [Acidobacteriota bacterium]MDW8257552.1 NADH-quinone oxidoreductase subunit NuoE [Acidobacteriota bacterium]